MVSSIWTESRIRRSSGWLIIWHNVRIPSVWHNYSPPKLESCILYYRYWPLGFFQLQPIIWNFSNSKLIFIGGLSIVWSIIWFSIVSIPEKDKFMSAKERRYILAANKYNSAQKVIFSFVSWKLSIVRLSSLFNFCSQTYCVFILKVTYPWRKIFTSKAVWAYWNDRFVEGWSTIFLAYCLPLYIKGKIKQNSIINHSFQSVLERFVS